MPRVVTGARKCLVALRELKRRLPYNHFLYVAALCWLWPIACCSNIKTAFFIFVFALIEGRNPLFYPLARISRKRHFVNRSSDIRCSSKGTDLNVGVRDRCFLLVETDVRQTAKHRARVVLDTNDCHFNGVVQGFKCWL